MCRYHFVCVFWGAYTPAQCIYLTGGIYIDIQFKNDIETLQAKYELLDRRMIEIIADMAILRYEMDLLKEGNIVDSI